MRRPIIRLFFMAVLAGLIILLIPLGKFAIYEKFGDNNYVTTAGAKYCYVAGRENRNLREGNKIYYSTAELCGKSLKK